MTYIIYHTVNSVANIAPKYRRKAFYGTRRLEIEAILRNLCDWKYMITSGRQIVRNVQ